MNPENVKNINKVEKYDEIWKMEGKWSEKLQLCTDVSDEILD